MIIRKCGICDMQMAEGESEHTDEQCREWAAESVTMKPMLGVLIREAVLMAAVECAEVPEIEGTLEQQLDHASHVRESWRWSPNKIPMDTISVEALANQVAVRFLGPGGWHVNGVYAGNAAPQELFDATIHRPNRSIMDEIAYDLGLAPE